MYADRHAGSRAIDPVSLGASLFAVGGVLLALVYAAPNVIGIKDHPIETTFIPIQPPPPPEPTPQPQPRAAHPAPQPFIPRPDVPLPKPSPIDIIPSVPGDPIAITGLNGGVTPAAEPSPTPLPPLVGAGIDPRYASDFQPTYPPSERRAEREGRVVVRVLIGVDGRVKQIERVSATSDAFFAATRDRALAKWRFKPATRGDVPVEQWKTMSVSFVLEDE